MSDPLPASPKQVGAILAVVGAILVLSAIVRLNSVESQLIRGFGGTDEQSSTMLVIGIPLLGIGVWMWNKPQETNSGAQDDPPDEDNSVASSQDTGEQDTPPGPPTGP